MRVDFVEIVIVLSEDIHKWATVIRRCIAGDFWTDVVEAAVITTNPDFHLAACACP